MDNLVYLQNDEPVCSSLQVAEKFGKRHADVMDGQTEYGSCEDYVSLISVDEYRKYRKLLPNTGEWWWTLTPDSTECNDDTRWIRVVSPSGSIYDYYYDGCDGVRPVCIFSSSIFESCEEDDD